MWQGRWLHAPAALQKILKHEGVHETVHYYKKNLGDYAKKAGRLSLLEHGVYNVLIDACYDREAFPSEEEAIEWCWARTDAEIEAVKFVLKRFFQFVDGKYIQKRIQEEIKTYHATCAINAKAATNRPRSNHGTWTKRPRSVDEPTTTPPSSGHLTINQEPRTINQEPLFGAEEPAPKKTHSRLEIFSEEYQATQHRAYIVGNFLAEGGAASRTVCKIPDDTLYRRAVRAYLAAGDKRIVDASYPFLWFVKEINRWVGVAEKENGNAHAKNDKYASVYG